METCDVTVKCIHLKGNSRCTAEDVMSLNFYKTLYNKVCKNINCGSGGTIDWVTYLIYKEHLIKL